MIEKGIFFKQKTIANIYIVYTIRGTLAAKVEVKIFANRPLKRDMDRCYIFWKMADILSEGILSACNDLDLSVVAEERLRSKAPYHKCTTILCYHLSRSMLDTRVTIIHVCRRNTGNKRKYFADRDEKFLNWQFSRSFLSFLGILSLGSYRFGHLKKSFL